MLDTAVEHVRALLSQRASLLSRLSDAYAFGASQGVQLAPGPGTYGSEWDEKWDESMRAEVLGGGGGTGDGAGDGVKEEEDAEGEADAEWEEDDA